jgi:hypothetical protein
MEILDYVRRVIGPVLFLVGVLIYLNEIRKTKGAK